MAVVRRPVRWLPRSLVRWLPRGETLPRTVLLARHRGILLVLWVHVPALLLYAAVDGPAALPDRALLVLPVAVLAGLASRDPLGGRVPRVAATLGLLTCSAVGVQLSGGLIEAHFHFFVVVAVIALYQDWVVFGLAIVFVAVHHAALSLLMPDAVFDHPMAQGAPVPWALLHAAFVLAAAAAHVVAWRSSEQGLYDGLTGLAGAGLLVQRLDQALRQGPTAVVYLDLDGFKAVNDTLGHAAGDQLLVAAARRMELALRRGDRLGRLGGDEFAAVLPGAGTADAAQVADRLVAAMTEPFVLSGRHWTVGVSAGVAAGRGDEDAERLLAAADAAMYAAKSAGKGQVALAA